MIPPYRNSRKKSVRLKIDISPSSSLVPSGIEPYQICCDGWSIGYDDRFPQARRIQQALVFARLYDHDNLYAHPLVLALPYRAQHWTNLRIGLYPRNRCQRTSCVTRRFVVMVPGPIQSVTCHQTSHPTTTGHPMDIPFPLPLPLLC